MKEPTEEEKKERNSAWADDLDINPKKTVKEMRAYGGRCCLAVAVDTALRLGAEGELETTQLPTPELAKFMGWDGTNPVLAVYGHLRIDAASLNDGDEEGRRTPELTHRQIAALVRHVLVEGNNPPELLPFLEDNQTKEQTQ